MIYQYILKKVTVALTLFFNQREYIRNKIITTNVGIKSNLLIRNSMQLK